MTATTATKPKSKVVQWGKNFELYYEEIPLPKYMAAHFLQAQHERKHRTKILDKARKVRQILARQHRVIKIEVRQLGIAKTVLVHNPNRKFLNANW